jgi:cytochrome c2
MQAPATWTGEYVTAHAIYKKTRRPQTENVHDQSSCGLRAAIAAVALTAAGAAAAQPAPDPASRRLFLQCQSCHSVKSGQPHKVGPNLAGVMGQRAGTRPGYNYSKRSRPRA